MMAFRGIKKLLHRGRRRFRSRENTHYYAPKDFKAAEEQYLIECVLRDHCGDENFDDPVAAKVPHRTQKPFLSRRFTLRRDNRDGNSRE